MASGTQEQRLPRTRRAFVSSTSIDLRPYREKVRQALLHLDLFPIMMEEFGANSEEPTTVAISRLRGADVYVGIIAWRYGTIPPGETRSVTHLEYLEARKLGLPCYLFLARPETDTDYTLFPADTRDPEHRTQLLAFRDQIQQGPTVAYFATPDELSSLVGLSLHKVILKWQQDAQKSVSKDRRTLLKRVQAIWVNGALNKSLEGASFIPLGLYERPSLIANPFSAERQEVGGHEGLLPTGTTIAQVFDESGEDALLILGAPGGGKTTMLLRLASDLLDRARLDASRPMPVIFNLSAWAEKRQPIAEWLVDELVSSKYNIGQQAAKSWVEDDQIVPLLDGLDEVAAEHRTACVHAINAYWEQHSSVPLVVGSRLAEYRALDSKLVGGQAVQVQPMTPEQVSEYLANDAGELDVLQIMVRENPAFQELAQNPLMLSILKRTGGAIHIDPNASLEEQSQQIFAEYVDTMLTRGQAKSRYTAKQTKGWLFWLSRQMQRSGQTTFYIENMQMDWLAKTLPYKLYFSLVLGLVSFLVTVTADTILFENWTIGLIMGLVDAGLALIFGWLVVNGVLIGVLPFFRNRVAEGEGKRRSWLSRFFRGLLANSLVFGLCAGLIDGSVAQLLAGPLYSSTHGLLFGAFFVVLGRFSQKIEPAALLRWSWGSVGRNAFISLVQGIGFGTLLGLFNAIPFYQQPDIFINTLAFGAAEGITLGILFMLLRGYARGTLDENQIIRPNQGIRNSLSNAFRVGFFAGVATAVVVFFYYSVVIHSVLKTGFASDIPSNSNVLFAGTVGPALGYLFWLVNGGFAALQHYMLRCALWQSRTTPARLARFLDYADSRILLRKVGGGYQFIHTRFLDYFANLGLKEASSSRNQLKRAG
jgi:hypothetical protein